MAERAFEPFLTQYKTKCKVMLADYEDNCEVEVCLPSVISYTSTSTIKNIKITFPDNNEFNLSNESLETIKFKNNNENEVSVAIFDSPDLEINEIFFQDSKFSQIVRIHLNNRQRTANTLSASLTPHQFYGKSNSTIFSIFPRQELAFNYYDEQENKESLKVFSFESSMTGKRKFLVCHLETFYSRYFPKGLKMNSGNRHVYEIIRENFPCRLYFDVEYNKLSNPNVDCEAIVELWISLTIWKIYNVYGITITSKNVIQLDSSNEVKFSRHLIFLLLVDQNRNHNQNRNRNRNQSSLLSPPSSSSTSLPLLTSYDEYLFVNNIEVGNFVLLTISECLENSNSSSAEKKNFILPRQFRNMSVKSNFSSLWLLNSDQTAYSCVVDLGVYTKNRAFRIFLSSKYGKESRFQILNQLQTTSSSSLSSSSSSQSQTTAPTPISLSNFTQTSSTPSSSFPSLSSSSQNWFSPDIQLNYDPNSTRKVEIERENNCLQQRKEDNLQYNYFIRKIRRGNGSNQTHFHESYHILASQILERTFVIPHLIHSPPTTIATTTTSVLPSQFHLLHSIQLQSPSYDVSYCLSCQKSCQGNQYCQECTNRSVSTISFPHEEPTFEGMMEVQFRSSENNNTSLEYHHSSDNHRHHQLNNMNHQNTNLGVELVTSKRLNLYGQCESPFPLFDWFTLQIAQRHAIDPKQVRITQFTIKSFSYSSIPTAAVTSEERSEEERAEVPQYYTITYQVIGTKFCHRIGRHHKSNHIMYEANLNQGYVVQKCWDPDCRGFKSTPYYLPHNSLPSINEIQEVITDIILTNSLHLVAG